MSPEFIARIQTFTARSSVTASATRGQGASGIAERAREHLARIPLRDFAVGSASAFARVLNRETALLAAAIPCAGRSWGLSRKLLNIFMRDSLYTVYLRDAFALDRVEQWYEVPLDGVVAQRVVREPEGAELAAWPGVKHLRPTESEACQRAFRAVAQRMRVAPVHLGAWSWGGDRSTAD